MLWVANLWILVVILVWHPTQMYSPCVCACVALCTMCLLTLVSCSVARFEAPRVGACLSVGEKVIVILILFAVWRTRNDVAQYWPRLASRVVAFLVSRSLWHVTHDAHFSRTHAVCYNDLSDLKGCWNRMCLSLALSFELCASYCGLHGLYSVLDRQDSVVSIWALVRFPIALIHGRDELKYLR